jgi:hypothetical protein
VLATQGQDARARQANRDCRTKYFHREPVCKGRASGKEAVRPFGRRARRSRRRSEHNRVVRRPGRCKCARRSLQFASIR